MTTSWGLDGRKEDPPTDRFGDDLTGRVNTALGQDGRHAGVVVAAFAGPETVIVGRGTTGQHGPPRADTIFQIGSITKVFTALALADAVTRHELSLNTPLSTYFPEANGRASAITLGHLAAHTSGLPRLPRGFTFKALRNRSDPYRNFTSEDLRAAIARARPRPAPGTKVRYSNFGAGLLGEALSRHAGLPFKRLIAERITGPLGLADTVLSLDQDQLPRRAQGYNRRRRPVPDWDLGAMPGAGALYSTPKDLLAFARAQLHPQTTPLAGAFRLVQEPQVKANRWMSVGLGWHLTPIPGAAHTSLWHNGGTGGFRSYLGLLPGADAGVIVLANTASSVDGIGFTVLRHLAGSADPR